MRIAINATVTYVCSLSKHDSEVVEEYMEETGCGIKDAIAELQDEGAIDIYAKVTESDSQTDYDTVEVLSEEEQSMH